MSDLTGEFRLKQVLAVAVALLITLGLSLPGSVAAGEGEVFTGYSQADDNGYVRAEVTLSEDDIVDVRLVEYDEMAREKGEDYPWDDWHAAMEELPRRFIEADDYDVDIVSGATGTSEKSIEAVEMALARADGEEHFSGRFMGISEIVERGWAVVWATVDIDEEAEEGYQLTDLRLEEVTGDEFKDEDYGWPEFHEAQEEMARRMLEANTFNVDTFTGATGSSELWIEAVQNALGKAGF